MPNILPFSNDKETDGLTSPLINNEENRSYLNFCNLHLCNLHLCNLNNFRYNFRKIYNYFFCIPEIDMESSDDYQNLNFNK